MKLEIYQIVVLSQDPNLVFGMSNQYPNYHKEFFLHQPFWQIQALVQYQNFLLESHYVLDLSTHTFHDLYRD